MPIQDPPYPPDRRLARGGPAASPSPGCQRCKSVPKPRVLYLVCAINPAQLKQQGKKGQAVPALWQSHLRLLTTTLAGSWWSRSGTVSAPGPLREESQASGLGRGGFLFHFEEATISLSTRSCCFTARNSFPISSPSHVPAASQVFPQRIPPTLKPLGKYSASTKANYKPAVSGLRSAAGALTGSPSHGFKPPSATPVMGMEAEGCWELQPQGFAQDLCWCKGRARRSCLNFCAFGCLQVALAHRVLPAARAGTEIKC